MRAVVVEPSVLETVQGNVFGMRNRLQHAERDYGRGVSNVDCDCGIESGICKKAKCIAKHRKLSQQYEAYHWEVTPTSMKEPK